MAHIAAIGEVMVELSPFPTADSNGREIMALSFAGDTYNTSVYMARLGLQTDYVTQLGDDPYSAQILQRMRDDNISTDLIKQLPGRSPGLYIIRNRPDGEREFFYWRKEAPARELFATQEAADNLCQQLANCDCVYLSGITLAIIGAASREFLYNSLHKLRQQGVTIAYDSNYRPRLWADKHEAQQAMLSMMKYTDIALLTLDDEQLLWGDDTIEGCKQRYAEFRLRELVLKRGADDAVIITHEGELRVPVPPVQGVVDTTGAGDTFNAGYLAGRLTHKSLEDSAKQGIRCASIIIRHRGAIIDKAVFAKELGA
ncbi:sugar kinase [Cellvibrio japonicus]|nr:sugar kinase [Cellvibrio japonicus]QEI10921.1 sugar kinase [Cellvibrio japonicus]QEI14497.1 sugar kinase [Cellvibrio japonicus]QEI18075.1 sugar kinase [Cellvibrio japonicus]